MATNYQSGCYFVISPNPEEGNYIHIAEKIKWKDGEEQMPGEQLHYVKFGDEQDFLSEVGAYNRANPSSKSECSIIPFIDSTVLTASPSPYPLAELR